MNDEAVQRAAAASAPEEQILADEILDSDASVATFLRCASRMTRDDVFQAANELLLEGQRPTLEQVRLRLGAHCPDTINDDLVAWWVRHGSRVQDEAVGQPGGLPVETDQGQAGLWDEVLEGTHETQRSTLVAREAALAEREQALAARAQDLDLREQAAAGRLAAFEESLQLAREQLIAANRSVEELHAALRERDAGEAQSRAWINALDGSCEDLQRQLLALSAAHQEERRELQAQQAASQAGWLHELEQSRRALADSQSEVAGLRERAGQLEAERDHLRQGTAGGVEATPVLQESLQLAREQLAAANRSIEELQAALRERDAGEVQSRAWINALDGSCEDLQRQLLAMTGAHHEERRELQVQHAAGEARLREEADQARQALEAAQQERDALRQQLAQAHGKLEGATAAREQWEGWLQNRRQPSLQARKFRP